MQGRASSPLHLPSRQSFQLQKELPPLGKRLLTRHPVYKPHSEDMPKSSLCGQMEPQRHQPGCQVIQLGYSRELGITQHRDVPLCEVGPEGGHLRRPSLWPGRLQEAGIHSLTKLKLLRISPWACANRLDQRSGILCSCAQRLQSLGPGGRLLRAHTVKCRAQHGILRIQVLLNRHQIRQGCLGSCHGLGRRKGSWNPVGSLSQSQTFMNASFEGPASASFEALPSTTSTCLNVQCLH